MIAPDDLRYTKIALNNGSGPMPALGFGTLIPDPVATRNATKAALEAHTLNLAAELRGTGVSVNVYRPGRVDTAMQEWIRGQDPDRIGAVLHTRFNQNFTAGSLITPEESAAALIAHLAGDDSGSIWDVSDAPAQV